MYYILSLNYKVTKLEKNSIFALVPQNQDHTHLTWRVRNVADGANRLVWTMMDSGLSVRQINIQKYLWVLFHVNVSMATTDGSL